MPVLVDRPRRRWTESARRLEREAIVAYLACRHPRTPWHTKLVAGCVVAYAFSPIDLVPDFIPVLGYLDDAILIPLGVALVLRLLPADVVAECRAEASVRTAKPVSRIGALAVVVVWAGLAWLACMILGDSS
jgi:uncharacterized membrane protein YkvA (DUF1232 family)